MTMTCSETDALEDGSIAIGKDRPTIDRRRMLFGIGASGAIAAGGLAAAGIRRLGSGVKTPIASAGPAPRTIPQSLAALEADPATVEALSHDLAGQAEYLHDSASVPKPRTDGGGLPFEASSPKHGDMAGPMNADAQSGQVSATDLAYLDKNAPKTAMGLSSVRGLWLVNPHTNETVSALFWNSGHYDNRIYTLMCSMMRDWRENETTPMDPRLFHLLWAIQRETGFSDPISITSGFRTVKTNTMLQAEGAAPNSQHMHSRACDIQIAGRPPGNIALAAQRLRIGGVGYYPTFTHVDTGPIRSWRA